MSPKLDYRVPADPYVQEQNARADMWSGLADLARALAAFIRTVREPLEKVNVEAYAAHLAALEAKETARRLARNEAKAAKRAAKQAADADSGSDGG